MTRGTTIDAAGYRSRTRALPPRPSDRPRTSAGRSVVRAFFSITPMLEDAMGLVPRAPWGSPPALAGGDELKLW